MIAADLAMGLWCVMWAFALLTYKEPLEHSYLMAFAQALPVACYVAARLT